MKCLRIETKFDSAINKGLAAAMLVNAAAGIKVMTDEGVPPEVITRLFLDPRSRRATDWKHPFSGVFAEPMGSFA